MYEKQRVLFVMFGSRFRGHFFVAVRGGLGAESFQLYQLWVVVLREICGVEAGGKYAALLTSFT